MDSRKKSIYTEIRSVLMYFLTTGMTTPKIFLSCMILPKTDGFCPAYDLTYSSSIGGEHTTAVNGKGVNPGMDDIMAVADHMKLNRSKSYDIAGNIRNIVQDELRDLIKQPGFVSVLFRCFSLPFPFPHHI